MMTLCPGVRIFLCREPVDFRKGVFGMSVFVREKLHEEPLSGGFFIFRNRRGNLLRVIYWDRNGYALWHKHLS